MGCHCSAEKENENKKNGINKDCVLDINCSRSFLLNASIGNLNGLKPLVNNNRVDINFHETFPFKRYKYDFNFNGDSALTFACFGNYYKTVKFLLENKADPNIKNKEGLSPLIISVSGNYVNIVKLLIKYDCDLEIKDKNNCNSLHKACDKNHIEIASILIKEGIDIESTNNLGDTPLITACKSKNKDISLFLIKCGADPTKKNNNGKCANDFMKEN